MINFFRQIRQNLLNEGKTSRYLKYAIGEIILVVIGILIALQINNWNEQRKKSNQEIVLMEQLLEDAQADSLFFVSRKARMVGQDSIYKMALQFKATDTLNKEKKYLFENNNSELFWIYSAYQSNLINNNPNAYDFISDQSLKTLLRNYNSKYEYVVKAIELSNRLNENYGTLLDVKYYHEINALKLSKAFSEFKVLMEKPDVIPYISKFEGTNENALKQINAMIEANSQLITDLKRKLKSYD